MSITSEDSVIMRKTKDLCETILAHPDYRQVKEQVDAFLGDEIAKNEYQSLVEKGDFLTEKQRQGIELSKTEVEDFETHRERVIGNPVAKGFIEAQREIHKVQESVTGYVSKTLELGRIPNAEDFEEGSCGSGCGCH